jgi:ABC-2 type transport system permease protein
MFLVTSIAMLRERTTGTLERLMSLPIGKVDLLLGYGLAFALLAAIQAVITGTVGFWLLGLHTKGSVVWVVLLAVANALLGVSLGLFLSAFAKTEFRRCSSCPRSSSRRSCSRACSRRATRCRASSASSRTFSR